MKEKIPASPPEDIRSDIVQKIHTYEQSLNAQVISLRAKIKGKCPLSPLDNKLTVPFELLITEIYLTSFRDIFRSYLPQIERKTKKV